MLRADIVAEFVEAGAELFEAFVGEEPNATYTLTTVVNPVTNQTSQVSTRVRAAKLDEHVGATKAERVYETVAYILQAELGAIAKDSMLVIDDEGTYRVASFTADPANVTWRAVLDG